MPIGNATWGDFTCDTEAEMVSALNKAVVGTTCLRSDVDPENGGTLFVCVALPHTSPANWFPYEAVLSGAGGGGPFVGAYTWAARPLTGLSVGNTFRASNIGRAPGTIYQWDGTRWIACWPLRRNTGRVSGVAQAAEQMPAGLNTPVPIDLLMAYRAIELEFIPRRDVATDAVNLLVRLGPSATLTANTLLLQQNNVLQSTDLGRLSSRWEWEIESSTAMRLLGVGTQGGMEGASGGTTTADATAVTVPDLSASDMNLSVGCTMGGATTIPTFNVVWTFKP